MTAKVTVDGVTQVFKDTWLVSVMKGKYFGGGCMVAPMQDRNNESGDLSVVLIHTKNRLKCLIAFSSVFSGKHLKEIKKCVIIIVYKKTRRNFLCRPRLPLN